MFSLFVTEEASVLNTDQELLTVIILKNGFIVHILFYVINYVVKNLGNILIQFISST